MKVERRRYVDPCESVISVDQGPIKHSAEREHHLQHVALRDRGYNIGGVFDCQESNRERAGCKTIHSQEPLMRERSMRNARWADAAATAILCVGICGALPATFAELPASMLETPPPRGMAPLRPQLRPLEGGAQLEEVKGYNLRRKTGIKIIFRESYESKTHFLISYFHVTVHFPHTIHIQF